MKSLHQHHSVIALLARKLDMLLPGSVLKDAFRDNQEGKEVVSNFIFEKDAESLTIQFSTEADCGLFFFRDDALERGNSVFPLFRNMHGRQVTDVQVHENDRSFAVCFENNEELVFRCYGVNSDVIIRSESESENEKENEKEKQKQKQKEKQKEHLIVIASEPPVLVLADDEELKNVHGDNNTTSTYDNVMEAMHAFSRLYVAWYRFSGLKTELTNACRKQLRKEEGLVIGIEKFFEQVKNELPPEEAGHILMANLHNIPAGVKEVKVFDFYRNQEVLIELKKDLSGPDNAARYYQKAKNRKKEMALKEKQYEQAKEKVILLKERLNKIASATTIRELEAFTEEKKKAGQEPLKEKFRHFLYEGYHIFVGKNAANNDLLTLKFAKKEDLWLHAKGAGGSHVVVRSKQGQSIPDAVIQVAAGLAAYYSTLKGSTMVPVIHTFKKFVRKPKGANPGQVAVDKEETILVEPRLPF